MGFVSFSTVKAVSPSSCDFNCQTHQYKMTVIQTITKPFDFTPHSVYLYFYLVQHFFKPPARIKGGAMVKEKKIICSVCGKTSYQYKDMVEDESAAICDTCIEYSPSEIEQRLKFKSLAENETLMQHLHREIEKLSLDEKRILLKDLRDRAFEDGRVADRIPYEVKVYYTIGEDFGHDYIYDLSRTGAFLETFEEYPIGEEVTLTIPLLDQERHVKVRGRVARNAENGIGIAFDRGNKS